MAAGLGLENPWPPWLAVIKAPLWNEPKYEGVGDCCRSLLLSLFVKSLILAWLVYSVLGSPSLRQAQVTTLQSQAVWS